MKGYISGYIACVVSNEDIPVMNQHLKTKEILNLYKFFN